MMLYLVWDYFKRTEQRRIPFIALYMRIIYQDHIDNKATKSVILKYSFCQRLPSCSRGKIKYPITQVFLQLYSQHQYPPLTKGLFSDEEGLNIKQLLWVTISTYIVRQ
uniref:SFRICE_011464 n=1 Tax=Spodoptera frugiperda TaxID=7108 RepID=A0A2H1W8M6_SPOFR